jgi:hypothetical protein
MKGGTRDRIGAVTARLACVWGFSGMDAGTRAAIISELRSIAPKVRPAQGALPPLRDFSVTANFRQLGFSGRCPSASEAEAVTRRSEMKKTLCMGVRSPGQRLK